MVGFWHYHHDITGSPHLAHDDAVTLLHRLPVGSALKISGWREQPRCSRWFHGVQASTEKEQLAQEFLGRFIPTQIHPNSCPRSTSQVASAAPVQASWPGYAWQLPTGPTFTGNSNGGNATTKEVQPTEKTHHDTIIGDFTTKTVDLMDLMARHQRGPDRWVLDATFVMLVTSNHFHWGILWREHASTHGFSFVSIIQSQCCECFLKPLEKMMVYIS